MTARAQMMMRRSLAHHPAGNMRQRPIELMDDEHVSPLETLTPNDNHGVPTPRVKRISERYTVRPYQASVTVTVPSAPLLRFEKNAQTPLAAATDHR